MMKISTMVIVAFEELSNTLSTIILIIAPNLMIFLEVIYLILIFRSNNHRNNHSKEIRIDDFKN